MSTWFEDYERVEEIAMHIAVSYLEDGNIIPVLGFESSHLAAYASRHTLFQEYIAIYSKYSHKSCELAGNITAFFWATLAAEVTGAVAAAQYVQGVLSRKEDV